jgi:hypothetical protein
MMATSSPAASGSSSGTAGQQGGRGWMAVGHEPAGIGHGAAGPRQLHHPAPDEVGHPGEHGDPQRRRTMRMV